MKGAASDWASAEKVGRLGAAECAATCESRTPWLILREALCFCAAHIRL